MTTRTEYLAGADQIDVSIYEILYDWISKEANNLQAFIDNPAEHVNYNEYMIFDFSKLNDRLTMLNQDVSYMNTIIQYKQGNTSFDSSMYEYALDQIGSIIFNRLLGWLAYTHDSMDKVINDNGDTNNASPLSDYIGMFTFDSTKFMNEYTVIGNAVQGCQAVVDYKVENGL